MLVSNMCTMRFTELCKELKEPANRVQHWRAELKRHELIEPKKSGNKDVYRPEDVEQFKKIQEYLSDGAESVSEAIDFIKGNITPYEALQRHEMLTNQLSATQKKVLDLKRPPWWEQIGDFFKKFWQKIWGGAS